jgi:hypothetical protein
VIFILSFIANILIFFIILSKNTQQNAEDLFLQLLIFMGVPILVGYFAVFMLIKRFSIISNYAIGLFNRLFTSILYLMLFIVPFDKVFLLDDFFFLVILIVNSWFWLTWAYILSSKYKK